jgi:hypothetical protein
MTQAPDVEGYVIGRMEHICKRSRRQNNVEEKKLNKVRRQPSLSSQEEEGDWRKKSNL